MKHSGGCLAGRNGNRLGRRWAMAAAGVLMLASASWAAQPVGRERVSFNADWRFARDDPNGAADKLSYNNIRDWVLPTGAAFTQDPNLANKQRPAGKLGADVAYTQPGFDDSGWRSLTLPHDWGIEGPFDPKAPGGTGKLPFFGIGWYRKHFAVPAGDEGRQFYLDVDGAMSYANVWLNGQYVGGWPYGYASWRVDLTRYVRFGGENVLAIRLENPPNSSRWYPGGGIYRNVWLVKTGPVHVGHWGTYLTTPEVSPAAATIKLKVTVDNNSRQAANVRVSTEIFPLDADGHRTETVVGSMAPVGLQMPPAGSAVAEGTGTVANPQLWGPLPQQRPNRYVAVTTVAQGDEVVDTYETPFGIRMLKFDPNAGFFINGAHIPLNGVNNHHDLGALGAAVNYRALQRQLEVLRDMGCNAIRTSHNPPAPELLELTDKMGFLVMDEAFDVWVRRKTPLDFHLIFPDWHEQDLRALVRRDRNCPSVILWSIGNEVGEQFADANGAMLARELNAIVHDEDPTRPTTTAMNVARPTSPFAASVDVISLNYQGAGIRGIPGQYPAFHQALPNKFIVSSETASALSSRGEYLFPVAGGYGAAVGPNSGEDRSNHHVSAYELYYAAFGASPDKVFASQEQHPYVGGEFVWTGWDYLGEPTPFYSSRSSYSGIIDLAGFKKDRFYLYQAHWRPDFPMAHILPHWTWPDRVGQVAPVHVFTSGDEAELFLNGKSLGRKIKGQYEYRLRWDEVTYEPGELKVVAYKNGREWATGVMKTAGPAARLLAQADRTMIAADGRDLSFVTATVADRDGVPVPRSQNRIRFSTDGPGEIVATDNGDPTSFESFQSKERNAFNGLCLAIIRARPGQVGTISLKAESEGLQEAVVALRGEATLLPSAAAKPESRTDASAAVVPQPAQLQVRKLIDAPLRDTSVCRGPDGTWFLTGTVEPFWDYNEGVKVWRSKNLTDWEPLGFVWKYGASPWHKPYLEKRKPLWAPEIHFLKGTFWLTYSLPGWDGTAKTSGCGLLKSTTGQAQGPYQDVQPAERLGDEIDASLFEDDDGTVYFLWHSGKIARMKPDMSSLAEPYRWLRTTTSDPNPRHHSGLCAGIFGKDSFDHVGYEGMFLFKAGGRYFFACSDQCEGRYSCYIAASASLYGPYTERYEAIPHAGHNVFFRDGQGQWWSTYFGDPGDRTAPWHQRPGILPIRIDRTGRIQPTALPESAQ